MPDTESLIQQTFQRLNPLIERKLESYLELDADCPADLREAMSYSLMAGGKRLRPCLVLLACEACGGTVERALPAACAIEMVHTYSLIHDDLPAMDDDDLRRGRPTNHKMFGEATAILAGDALLTRAFEVLARDVHPAEVAAQCCTDLAAAAGPSGMVGGQSADLAAEHAKSTTLEQLEAIHRRKTGRLITSALTMGARIALANEQTRENLQNYGICIGLAFQITDDLLDLTGDQEKMGKALQKDATHGKLTYPALMGVEASRQLAEKLVESACQSVCSLEQSLDDQARVESSALPGLAEDAAAPPSRQDTRDVSRQMLKQLARFVLERDH